jgi:acyl carrier protein
VKNLDKVKKRQKSGSSRHAGYIDTTESSFLYWRSMSVDGDQLKKQILEKVVEILREVLNLQTDEQAIELETRFIEDLGAESLDMAQFVMSLEDEFQRPIEDEELTEIKSVGDAVDYIYKKSTEPDE